MCGFVFWRFLKTFYLNRKSIVKLSSWQDKNNPSCKDLFLSKHLKSNATKMETRKQRFSLSDYDIIGFDLDGTLLRYNLDELAPLIYNLLIQYLVKRKSFPKDLLDSNFNPDFIQKGLIIDTQRGNIIKLSSIGTILRATHGTRPLTFPEIEDIYGKGGCWQLAAKFSTDPLSVYKGPKSDQLYSLLDFFDYSVALVFAQAVDIIDETMTVKPKVYHIWQDIYAGLIELYKREDISNGQTNIFKAIKSEPDRYLFHTSTNVLKLINDLRSAGKSLYLLTGSYADFANFTSTYALGENWQQLFDFVICRARKPQFFKSQNSFSLTDKKSGNTIRELRIDEYLLPNTIYSHGNWYQLFESLKKTNKLQENACSLYIGDNLLQDIYAPFTCGIQTVAVAEEILIEDGNSEFKYSLPSNCWSNYFTTDNRMTYWSNVIEKYANLCIPRLDVLADLPINSKIKLDNNGAYFPKLPDALISLN